MHANYMDMDRARYIATMILNTAFGQKKSYKPTDILVLPIDGIEQVIEMTIEEVERMFEEDMKHLKILPHQIN